MTNNRKCICCGKEYYFCNHCNSKGENTGISSDYDTDECKELSNAISGYTMKIWGKDNVKKVLDKYHITDYSKYKESVTSILNDLFSNNGFKSLYNEEVKDVEVTDDTDKEVSEELSDDTEATDDENDIPIENKSKRKQKSREKKMVLENETEYRQSNYGDNLY